MRPRLQFPSVAVSVILVSPPCPRRFVGPNAAGTTLSWHQRNAGMLALPHTAMAKRAACAELVNPGTAGLPADDRRGALTRPTGRAKAPARVLAFPPACAAALASLNAS